MDGAVATERRVEKCYWGSRWCSHAYERKKWGITQIECVELDIRNGRWVSVDTKLVPDVIVKVVFGFTVAQAFIF